MTPRSLTRTLFATVVLGALAIAPGRRAARVAGYAAAKQITAAGVGKVKLGRTFHRAARRGG